MLLHTCSLPSTGLQGPAAQSTESLISKETHGHGPLNCFDSMFLNDLAEFGFRTLRSPLSRSASFLIAFLPLSLYCSPDLQRQREKSGSEVGVMN